MSCNININYTNIIIMCIHYSLVNVYMRMNNNCQ